MEEHTPENPYCSKPGCWCHTDLEYHQAIVDPFDFVTSEQVTEAISFLAIAE